VSNPEDKKPNPPGDPASRYVSPKLRTKMDFDEEAEETSNSKMANIVGIVMLVATVVLGGLFWTSYQHSKSEEKAKAVAAAKAEAEQATVDSLAKARQDSTYAASQDSIKKYEDAHPKPKTAPTTAPTATNTPGGAAGGETAPAPPPSKFGIDVGSFLTQDRANSEQGKLQGSTSLPARVVPRSEDGGTAFHVVIGEFTNRKDAEKKANELIVAQVIREATVTKLKP
jgi:cytoskeletal protein RodZ